MAKMPPGPFTKGRTGTPAFRPVGSANKLPIGNYTKGKPGTPAYRPVGKPTVSTPLPPYKPGSSGGKPMQPKPPVRPGSSGGKPAQPSTGSRFGAMGDMIMRGMLGQPTGMRTKKRLTRPEIGLEAGPAMPRASRKPPVRTLPAKLTGSFTKGKPGTPAFRPVGAPSGPVTKGRTGTPAFRPVGKPKKV